MGAPQQVLLGINVAQDSTLLDDIVAYWKLDESSGNAADSVGSNTLTATSVTYGAGKINNGATISTKLLSTTTPVSGTSDWTVSMWFKTSTSGTNKALALWGNSAQSTNTIMYFFMFNDNKIYLQTAGAGIITTSNTYADGNYHLAILQKSGDNFNLYIDNSADGSGTRAGINLGTNLCSIGYDNPNSRWSWGAQLDEIGWWSRALTSDERTELWNAGSGNQYPF